MMVDKPDRWSTSALETWAHQHTSSICRWHLMWKTSSVFISALGDQEGLDPRGSVFLYLRAEQTLSVHTALEQVYFGDDTERTAIPYPL